MYINANINNNRYLMLFNNMYSFAVIIIYYDALMRRKTLADIAERFNCIILIL